MGEKEFLLTQEGLNQHKEELEFLKTTRRTEIAEKIKVARGFGDLSENAEYDEAKNEQAQVEERINYLENMLLYAKVIEEDEEKKDVVTIGSTVTYKILDTNKEKTYKIVGTAEADPFSGRISNESPTGKALLNLKVGDTTTFETPGGIVKIMVLTVKKG
ncbi:transcription elongation factor GreA [uncultured Finegoldia sp.]|uniref:transcription elongation factor GreA n=1 Tax=uncultured Finegoldia sp. TaxID=328009 RepID=UPI002611549D|nr:transcription elongation factor GreA [uncultured Finegoldia sp.]